MARSGTPPSFDLSKWAVGPVLGRELIVVWTLGAPMYGGRLHNAKLRPLELSALFTHNVEDARFDEVCDVVRAPWRGYG
jgi:hypothetical protein